MRVVYARLHALVCREYSTVPLATSCNLPTPVRAALIKKTLKESYLVKAPRLARRTSSLLTRVMAEQQHQVLQPIQVTSTSLKTYTGDSILSNCFSEASVTEKDSDGVVLGLVSTEGPVALHDINLGEASQLYLALSLLPSTAVAANSLPNPNVMFAAAALQ